MAKKTRIDRRGKIRSIVRKFPKEKRQHWSIVKRAQVWERRRIVDEVFAAENITVTDTITPHLNRFVNDSLSTSDAVNIDNSVLMISTATITDDGTIVKDFQQPANADSISFSDSIGFDLGTLSGMFNAAKFNGTTFGAIMADQEFYTDSLTATDSVAWEVTKAPTETATITDSIGLNFEVSSLINAAPMGLSQFND
tara:strand:+ start:73 stop:663 length:591 start_codon:yes stop_codon:yes gene_type:complete